MLVEINQLVKRYKDLIAVDHLSLSVAEGEIYGLLGPNGSGKTTVINCMLSLLSYDSGSVYLFGKEMTPTNYEIKKRIGLVMQNIGVYDELSVEENIDYFCGLYIRDKNLRREAVNDAIKFVELDDFRKFRPKKLSGGLLRRLNLACGIAHRPDLIILDEPTVAVDPQSRSRILEGIKDLAHQGKTIIYTTHYMEEVEYLCDRLTIIDKGKEIITGTSEEIKNISSKGEVVTMDIFELGSVAKERLSQLPGLLSFNYENGKANFVFSKGQSHLIQLLRILEDFQVEVLNISVKRPSLNDVFLEVTGKELRDNV
ncbi:ABC transporter ATP-binding protein [Facklamia miroungae]|uniref:ABC-2 type transport system ATP-binding protein n=1 Tax=Facklamia miroungae TaxID=120956 RepID=A0A1G7QSQ8_9LACT|nr:ABC transporter ATP-binding protein [Facklamia miroungae]NKZ29051.1 ABC transporter ATP-binding protein [Facklamia miroungae]SDG01558.1 ABC-2 type transport system ATP-binding protein [Facklamia miroungae]